MYSGKNIPNNTEVRMKISLLTRAARRALLVGAVIGSSLGALAQAAPQVSWVNFPGGVSVASDAAGNVYTANWDYNPAGDILLTKRNASGAVLWESRFDNLDSTRHEVATWVAADAAGNAWVSGTIRSGFSSPVNANSVLMKFGPDGTLLWRRVYGNDFDGSSTRRFVLDAQGRAYVLGLGVCPSGLMSTVRQFNADGSDGWTWCDASGIGAPLMIKRTPDAHTLIVTRTTTGLFNGYAKISDQGQTVWSRSGVAGTTTGDAAGDAAGHTYTVDGDATGTVVRQLTAAGAEAWSRHHPMAAFRVEVGPDALPVLGGWPGPGTVSAAFAKYSAAGDLLWSQADADGPGVGLLSISHLLVDAAGGAYLSGTTLFEMGVSKVNADGTPGWTLLAPGGTTAAMAFGPSGQVYVTGGQTARLDSDPVAPPPTVDVALALTDAPDPLKVGATLVYTATVTNLGNTAAAGVTYQQALPRTVTWQGAVPSVGTCTGTRSVSCSLGTLPAGGTATVSVMVRVARAGKLAGSGQVTTTSVDANAANNAASTSTTVSR
jgi:uncharacterized repeat protein (TIGR01451 family)